MSEELTEIEQEDIEIEMNQLRDRAKRNQPITDEMWEKVGKYNRKKVEEFLEEMVDLSPKTLTQYKSALREFYYWVYEELDDKKIHKIKKLEFKRYQTSLTRRGVSSNGIKMKRSAISSMNKYIINYYEDYEEFESFRNFVEGVPTPTKNKVYNKVPLSKEEYNLICSTLEKQEKWQLLAAIKVLYSSGCRRSELIQLKKELANSIPIEKEDENGVIKKFYKSAPIRAKGKGEQGEVRPLLVDQEAIDAINKWLEIRGDDKCQYIFVTKYNGTIKQINASTINYWFSDIISKIIGRRVNVHLTRGSRVTIGLEEGMNIKQLSKLLGHKDVSTTQNFYDLRDDEDELGSLF